MKSLLVVLSVLALFTPLIHAQEHDEHHDEVQPLDASTWFYGIGASIVAGLASLSAVGLLVLRPATVHAILPDLVGLGIGTLLGTAFFLLLPETGEVFEVDRAVSSVMLSGILFGWVLEHLLPHLHHKADEEHRDPSMRQLSQADDDGERTEDVQMQAVGSSAADLEAAGTSSDSPSPTTSEAHSHSHTHSHAQSKEDRSHIVRMVIVGDALHNFIDGVLIAGTFLVDTKSGLTTTLGILLHELPQEVGDFCLLRHAGLSNARALMYNFLSSLTALVGVVIVFSLEESHDIEKVTNYFMPFAAGLFIYLALAPLLTELTVLPERSRRMRAFAAAAVGILLILAVSYIPLGEHSHGDDEHDDHDDHDEHVEP